MLAVLPNVDRANILQEQEIQAVRDGNLADADRIEHQSAALAAAIGRSEVAHGFSFCVQPG